MKNIGIVILNWNNYEDTKRCIDSILLSVKNTDNIKIFLIDNNSLDKSGEKLNNKFSNKLYYFNTGYNGGYTGGNNFGIKKAIEHNCDYILVLNNDLYIENFNFMIKDI